jgi:hypothetical protein
MLRLGAWIVRVALALAFASLVASRIRLGGMTGGEAALAWLPEAIQRVGSWVITVAEILLGLALLTGWQARSAALLSAIVFFLHGVVLCASVGLAAPRAYFAFAAASAAFLLFAIQPPNPSDKTI